MSRSAYRRARTAVIVMTMVFSVLLLSVNYTDIFLEECRLGEDTKLFLPPMTLHQKSSVTGKCPSVLSHMTRGHWKTRPLTQQENKDIMSFLTNAHARFRMPANYQRGDGLCGNVTYTGSAPSTWFRALCDPTGPTPCCYHNQCASKSVSECVCADCYDLRQMKHAEYSTWVPSHPACHYREHSPQEACDILRGMNIAFIGDSLVRHVYTALLLVMTGNMDYGAVQESVDQNSRILCRGMYMFTEKKCRLLLKKTFRGCQNTVHLENIYYYSSEFGQNIRKWALSTWEKTLIFTGVGIHDYFNVTKVQTKFLRPMLTCMVSYNRTWPRLLWSDSHAPGILKSPALLSQLYGSVKQYNSKMERALTTWNIPIFSTFNLTDGMMSFDGEHYGRGMNIVKANILLSYIEELRVNEGW